MNTSKLPGSVAAGLVHFTVRTMLPVQSKLTNSPLYFVFMGLLLPRLLRRFGGIGLIKFSYSWEVCYQYIFISEAILYPFSASSKKGLIPLAIMTAASVFMTTKTKSALDAIERTLEGSSPITDDENVVIYGAPNNTTFVPRMVTSRRSNGLKNYPSVTGGGMVVSSREASSF
jgi:hypothetical protein